MGLLLAFLTACSEGAKDVFHSQARMRPLSPVYKAWSVIMYSWPFIFAAFLVHACIVGWPVIGEGFWLYMSIHAVLVAVALVLFMYALGAAPLWMAQPVLGLTPVFMLVTTPLMTNDRLTLWSGVGIVIIAVGIYAVSHPGKIKNKDGKLEMPAFWEPIRQVVKQPGVGAKFVVAAIFSVTANLDKLSVERSTPFFYPVIDLVVMWVLLSIALLVMRRRGMKLIDISKIETDPKTGKSYSIPTPRYLFIGGALNAGMILAHLWALTYLAAPFVVAVKRTSIFHSSMWDYYVRKTRRPRWFNIAGVLMVVAGVVVFSLWGKE